MTEEYIPLEKEIASFFIGFAADTNEGERLSRGYSDIIEKINFSLCPNISSEIFYQIENKFFENNLFDEYIRYWNKLGGYLPRNSIQEKNRQKRLGNYDKAPSTIKITQKMIFSFFSGISNSIPNDYDESMFFKINDIFLNKISKELCYDEDLERLQDLDHYLGSNLKSFEIRDAMLFKINGSVSWSKSSYSEKDLITEEDAMLRNFQEKYKWVLQIW